MATTAILEKTNGSDLLKSTESDHTKDLNTTHRCDSCEAQAWVQVFLRASDRLPEGGELLFCGHHYNKNKAALKPYAMHIKNELARLVQNKLKGSENS